MNALYIAFNHFSEKNGVTKKIVDQVDALARLGYSTFVLFLSRKVGVQLFEYRHDRLSGIKNYCQAVPGFFRSTWFFIKCCLYIYRAVKFTNPKIIYIRRFIPLLPIYFTAILLSRAKHATSIYEIPTYPFLREEIKNQSYLSLCLELLWGWMPYVFCNKVLIIGNKRHFSLRKVSCLSNGISVERICIRTPILKDDRYILLSVSFPAPWHGHDLLLESIADYNLKNRKKIELYFVGDFNTDSGRRVKTKVFEKGLAKQIHFPGIIQGDELNDLYNIAHLGIGSLAMNRIGLSWGSSLKNREYCAKGLPFLLKFVDADFPESVPFVYYDLAIESLIDFKAAFIWLDETYQAHPNLHYEMHKFAADNLDWAIKMKTALQISEIR